MVHVGTSSTIAAVTKERGVWIEGLWYTLFDEERLTLADIGLAPPPEPDPAELPDPCPNHTDEHGPHHSDVCCYYEPE